jgi:diguanylate cyclase (GGDEF)-like protein
MRVLAIVDDTPDVRRMVRVLLERAGATVGAEVATVTDAVGVLDASSVGVVILDHHLDGGILGFDGAAMLKERAPLAKVVLFSAMDLAADAARNPAIDAFVRKDLVLDLPRVVRSLDPIEAKEPRVMVDRLEISPEDLLLARWVSTPSLLFGTLPPPIEAGDVIGQLVCPTSNRSEVLLAFVTAAGDIDGAVAHLLVLRRLIETQRNPRIEVDLDLLDILIVEVTSNVISAARRAAMVDPLTMLGNRRALELEMGSALARAERARQPLTLLYFDLIGLKAINDQHGHDEGDAVLTTFARALEVVKRTGDSGYRIGGDEFVAVLPNTAGDDAEQFLKRLTAFGAPSFSVGIATTEADGFDFARLVQLADVRMLQDRYRAVGEGPRSEAAPRVQPRSGKVGP